LGSGFLLAALIALIYDLAHALFCGSGFAVTALRLPRDNQDENAATIKMRIDACWNGVGRSP
ncbi:MAG: hypothetical protein ACREVF_09705, partial [Burkholderiales bacterium]